MHLLPLLFADQQAIRNIARGVQSRQAQVDVGDVLTALLIFCLFFVSVWGISRLVSRQERAASCLDPRALFLALCRAHQLNRSDRQLLRQLAQVYKLSQPALLFVEPDRFDAADLGGAWQRQCPRLAELRSRLFEGLDTVNRLQRDSSPTTIRAARVEPSSDL